ncbi:alpha/beta-Hydrolase [Glarea lozoyensis ATCC 20868]|uniref:Alpha/beta-Hydrolase n=2 Tax=Glarea lozoyensis TaxID=101852 RepID=S3CIE4_GLAL2|nr:alpha/beta-Hydrolase [Glarea lozoyensis ATCC 20868]EHL01309.1 putative lipase [Glarea lozoyensis 74030]EPE25034.1 alpha/beta-Hydrolase [Glarea lozoyensis ATCC 20868]
MLLLYQTGSVKIGELVRYEVTYTPSHDRILPSPTHLFLRIKNTSAIALRAAFVHGPYTLYASAYPANFNPNEKFENPRAYGVPEFEPNLKAGGTFTTKLAVPEHVRKTAGSADRDGHSAGQESKGGEENVSWIIEVSSQVIFSTSAAVHYEVLLGRDEKSLQLGYVNPLVGGTPAPVPGHISDHQQSSAAKDGHHNAQPKGIFSKAVKLKVDDTASLWNTPKMPEWDEEHVEKEKQKGIPVERAADSADDINKSDKHRGKRQKKVHLVVLTHGLHSNLGADMLYMKESIDASARQARIDAKARRAKRREEQRQKAGDDEARQKVDEDHKSEADKDKSPAEKLEEDIDSDDDEEEVIVRGFSGNATRTERGIKYLGKRLAKYVLTMTYPDQPYRPVTKKTAAEAISHAMKPSTSSQGGTASKGSPSHKDSTIQKEPTSDSNSAFKFTSISFIAHSLGGLVQTYAVAYIQKHSPEFFDIIKPINFIALASPFLGLSNENPLYVKFALDFGLVGRTGQDLGLTWRAPTIARSGWGAIVGGMTDSAHKKIEGEAPPESKPLLRILPTGPAHTVLKKFRNRTVYSNVVNDGVVPLRTSCLLFLDWQGLGRVEKARRENGLVGTITSWGWAELTGQNTVSPMGRTFSESHDNPVGSDSDTPGTNTPTQHGHGEDVPQPPPYATQDDNRSIRAVRERSGSMRSVNSDGDPSQPQQEGPFSSIVKFFQPNTGSKPSSKVESQGPKPNKIYKRSQTLRIDDESGESVPKIARQPSSPKRTRGKATANHSDDENSGHMSAPPKTTFFEAAGDLLKPPLATVEFLINPESRARTIFHDRVYHPSDIPPPPLKKRPTTSLLTRRSSSNIAHSSGSSSSSAFTPPPRAGSNLSTADYDDTRNTNPEIAPNEVVDGSAMKVEEKIARAYHKDLSWRKVLVRLEPDAHNNMIVRRMFANAYGWPVVKHLCDTHFSDSAVAKVRDEDDSNAERAKGTEENPDRVGRETRDDPITTLKRQDRTDSEVREASDDVPEMNHSSHPRSLGKAMNKAQASGNESEGWSERDWVDSADDSDDFEDDMVPGQKAKNDKARASSPSGAKKGGWNWTEAIAGKGATSPRGTAPKEIDSFLGKNQGRAGGRGPGSPIRHQGDLVVGSPEEFVPEIERAGVSAASGVAAGGDGLPVREARDVDVKTALKSGEVGSKSQTSAESA